MTVVQRLMGVETEYALTALTAAGTCSDRAEAVRMLLIEAAQQIPHIRDYTNGMFLSNGSRLYIDSGLHPEISTPECSDPADVVAYILAGEQILHELAQSLKETGTLSEVQLFKVNVDYGGTQATWGCHESYLHRTDPGRLCSQILPHLVSRVIYTGAGGFNPGNQDLEFTLSPRVAYLRHAVSPESTHSRGIFHTKNETLTSRGYNRLHIICGESLCSETATWLKVGVTAIVVAMIEADVCRAEAVQLANPVDAMRSFVKDPQCKLTAELCDGSRLGAIDIQRHYLTQAEAHLDREFMPEWAGAVCERWRTILDRLDDSPDRTMTILDWAMKFHIYKDHARRRGFSWESLTQWNYVVFTLKTALARTECRDRHPSIDFLLDEKSPIADEVKKLTPLLSENQLKWEDLSRFVDLKREFFEIDTRFAQLGEIGIFHRLDRSSLLSHRVIRRAVEEAVSSPPRLGRAKLRGDFVARHASDGGRYWCDWEGIWDYKERRVLDLSDPFESAERWREFNGQDRNSGRAFVPSEMRASFRPPRRSS